MKKSNAGRIMIVIALWLFASCTNKAAPAGREGIIRIRYGHKVGSTISFPEGQSIDDNLYLGFIKEEFGIELIYDWVCMSSEYEQKIDLCIESNTLPDIMQVNERQFRRMLSNRQIRPLTDAYDKYASDMLKAIVGGGGRELVDFVIENGEMMAIPIPHIDDSVNVMWIRLDWLEKLGMEYPRTMDELVETAKAFIAHDPAGNGETIGILGPSSSGELAIHGGNRWGFDPIFSAYGSFPGFWFENTDGSVYYGSLTGETRRALGAIADLYREGVIDPELFLRNDSLSAVLEDKAGIFFGPWWCGYTIKAGILSGTMDWTAHCAPVSDDGKFYSKMAPPASQYIVVSKNCDYPQAAIQIINLLLRDEQKWIEQGFNAQLSMSSSYPLFTVYDNVDEIRTSFDILDKWLRNEITMDDVDFTRHKLLKNDMEMLKILKKEPLDNFSIRYWDLGHPAASSNMARLYSFMVGQRAISTEGYEPVFSAYYGYTAAMLEKWGNLRELETGMFNRIVMGDADISEFDEFTHMWLTLGGRDIQKEIEQIINRK